MPRGEYLEYGGQALIEGVMMRTPRNFAVACRAPNGEILVRTEPLESTWLGRQKWLKTPLIRGGAALFDAMELGYKAMRFATGVQLDPAYQVEPAIKPASPDEAQAVLDERKAQRDKRIASIGVAGAMITGLLLGIVIFVVIPNLTAEQLTRVNVRNGMLINLVTEIIKITLFIGYLWAISNIPEIRRWLAYHGAEHKAITTLEAEEALTMESCRKQTRFHPRCGTSFAVIVFLISLVLFTFVPRYPFSGGQPGASRIVDVALRVLIELCILPLVAGISYELLRIAGKFRNEKWVQRAFLPGLLTQRITTKEPDDSQIEVALAALRAVMDVEAKTSAAKEPAPADEAAASLA